MGRFPKKIRPGNFGRSRDSDQPMADNEVGETRHFLGGLHVLKRRTRAP